MLKPVCCLGTVAMETNENAPCIRSPLCCLDSTKTVIALAGVEGRADSAAGRLLMLGGGGLTQCLFLMIDSLSLLDKKEMRNKCLGNTHIEKYTPEYCLASAHLQHPNLK